MLKTLDELMALTRVELANFCKQNKPKPKYMISKIAEKYNVKILFLPVAHPELNPIELVWSMLKKYIKEKNVIILCLKWKNMLMNFLLLINNLLGRNVLNM